LAWSRTRHANFDVPWIGQFVLGRYWRLATPEQREAYLKLFSDVIVFTYVRRFDDYESQQLQVLGHRDDGKDFILVDSRIHKPGTSAGAVGVVWRVLPVGDGQRIVDVVIEGVSMSITQRNEYASVIQRNGGSVQSLIDALKENVDRLRQQG
jgi:phospholipid transport system substrate-binding protein